MRHRKKTDRLSKSKAKREALVKSSVRNLLIYESIKTTTRRAKVISAKTEELISLAKRNDLHSKRLAYALLQDHKLVKKLFEEIAPRFIQTRGGCVRRIGFGTRKGDGAELSLLQLSLLKNKESPKSGSLKKEKPASEKKKGSSENVQKKKTPPPEGLKKGLKKIFKKKTLPNTKKV
jgi:large subunit ribosomal protein L17